MLEMWLKIWRYLCLLFCDVNHSALLSNRSARPSFSLRAQRHAHARDRLKPVVLVLHYSYKALFYYKHYDVNPGWEHFLILI